MREAVKNGDFREDLYHRINEFSIQSPSLKDRDEDLMVFADYFLEKANQQLNKDIIGFSPEVVSIFQNYNWPGNLRELQNCVKRATLLSKGDFIESDVLPVEFFQIQKQSSANGNFSLSENEKEAIIQALSKAQNNKSEAAKLLNLCYNALIYYKVFFW